MTAIEADMQADKRVASRVRRAYALALSLMAVATIAAFLIENAMVKEFEGSSSALNVVSEQRTLTHQIALFSSDVATARNPMARELGVGNLEQTKEKMVAAHEGLLQRTYHLNGQEHLTPEIQAIFHETPYSLNERMLKFIDKIDAFLDSEGEAMKARYNAVYFQAIGPLDNALSAAVEQLENETRADVEIMRQVRVALTAMLMLMIAGEWLFIFRPLANAVEQKTRALEEARQSVTHAAMHDPLTDLPNRRMLDTVLPTMLAQGQRLGKPLTVCHLDLDKFKNVNDTLGHSVGDKVLLHATTVLRNATRASDFIARVGGDEFVIVDCTFGGYEGAGVMADRIVDRMSRAFEVDGHVCRVGASIGIAIHDPEDEDLEAIMCRADVALYYAKELGRGQSQPYSEEAQDAFLRRLKQDEKAA